MLHRLRFAFVEVVLAWIAFDVWESIHSSMVDLPIHWSKTRRQRNDWDRQFVRMTYICLLNTWKILFFRWLSNLLIKREFVTNFKCLTDRTNDMNCFILEQFNERERVFKSRLSNLSFCFEDITTKGIAVIVTCDETEDFQILTIVWDVEDSERLREGKKQMDVSGKVLPVNWILEKNGSSWIGVSIFLTRFRGWRRTKGKLYFICLGWRYFDTISGYREIYRTFLHSSCFEFILNWIVSRTFDCLREKRNLHEYGA